MDGGDLDFDLDLDDGDSGCDNLVDDVDEGNEEEEEQDGVINDGSCFGFSEFSLLLGAIFG